MIRFILGAFVAYVVFKMIRIFVDPFFETKNVKTNTNMPSSSKTTNDATPPLGEYVEYEEVK